MVDLGELELSSPEPEPAPLVPANTIRLVVEPYIQERDRVITERDEARAKVEDLQRQVGRLEGKLEASQRPWWKRLFGR